MKVYIFCSIITLVLFSSLSPLIAQLDDTTSAIWIDTGRLGSATDVLSLVRGLDGTIYAGTGWWTPDVFKTNDGGSNWSNTAGIGNAMQAYCMLSASDGAIYVGTGQEGRVVKSNDGGVTWQDGGYLPGGFENFVLCLFETSDGTIYAGQGMHGGNIYKTSDGGSSWYYVTTLIGADHIWSILEDSDNALYAGTSPNGDVFKSTDGGATWLNTSNLAGATVIKKLVLAIDNAIYAATAPNGDIFKTVDGGLNWNNTGELTGVDYVSSLIAGSRGFLYAGASHNGTAYFSNDGGENWISMGAIPGTDEIQSLLEADGYLYAGCRITGRVYKKHIPSSPAPTPTITPVPTEPPTYTPTAMPTMTPTVTSTPLPQGHIVLTVSSLKKKTTVVGMFVLDSAIERPFTAFAVLIRPDGLIVNAGNLKTSLKPFLVNYPWLAMPFSYRFMWAKIPKKWPKGLYEVVVAFFDPDEPTYNRADAFLEVSAEFTLQ